MNGYTNEERVPFWKIERLKIGEGPMMNAIDAGIVEVEMPPSGSSVSMIRFKDGHVVLTNKPIEAWYR